MRWASNWFLFFSLLSTGLLACGRGAPPASGSGDPPPAHTAHLTFKARYEDGQPIPATTVLLNEEDVGQTNSTGELSLDIPPGVYTARLRLGTEVEREFSAERRIDLGTSSQEVTFTLPRPVRWREPLEVTVSRVHVAWEPTTEPDFREYRLYASNYSSAVEGPGAQLVHVETEASRTEYVLNSSLVLANKDIYFRLSIVKTDGSQTLSNVLHVKTPSWDNEAHFTRFYTLSVEHQFAGDRPIQGIAYDGTALWLMYYVVTARNNGEVTLARIDPNTRRVLKEFTFEDSRRPFGLTWDGESLWLTLTRVGGDTLVRFNPSTGAQEKSFMIIPGTASLAWSGGQILPSKSFPQEKIEGIDPVTGSILSARPNPSVQYGGSRATGIAARPGEVWLADMFRDDMVIVDDAGVHVGAVKDSSRFRHMTFMGEKLVGVTPSSQVVIMSIQEAPRPP